MTWKKCILLSDELKIVFCLIDGQHKNTPIVDFSKKPLGGCAFVRSKIGEATFDNWITVNKHDIIWIMLGLFYSLHDQSQSLDFSTMLSAGGHNINAGRVNATVT